MSTSMVELLSDYELDTLVRLAREAHRRSTKAAAKNRETGLVDELPGEDADAVRAANLGVLIEKLECLQDEALPSSFMTPAPRDVAIPAEVYAARAQRAEADRDAAEELADRRGAMLAEVYAADGTSLPGVLDRVHEHLIVTGEVDAGD